MLEVANQARLLSKDVEVRLGEMDQAHVMGDVDRLKQLLLNLISNGLKYTPPGGVVTLSLRRGAEWAEIVVADTGVGIPEHDLPHIFDRFYRVDKARSRAQGGTGLGLSIAKWLAEAHGGTLSVASRVGEGTCFTLRLPAADPSPPAAEPAAPGSRPLTAAPRAFSRQALTHQSLSCALHIRYKFCETKIVGMRQTVAPGVQPMFRTPQRSCEATA